jgi:hypothetical protein
MKILDQQQTIKSDYPVFGIAATIKVAQTFKPTVTFPLARFEVFLSKVGVPADQLQLQIYSDNAGVPGTLLVTADNQIQGSGLLVGFDKPTKCVFDFSFSPTLTTGTTYWAVLSRTGPTDEANFYRVFTSDIQRVLAFLYDGLWSGVVL